MLLGIALDSLGAFDNTLLTHYLFVNLVSKSEAQSRVQKISFIFDNLVLDKWYHMGIYDSSSNSIYSFVYQGLLKIVHLCFFFKWWMM